MTRRSKRLRSHRGEQYFKEKHLVNLRVKDTARLAICLCARVQFPSKPDGDSLNDAI
jgi:hypothetical protein